MQASAVRVIETTLDEDLSLFSRYLWQQRVRHRIFEEGGRQVVEVAEARSADPVRAAYRAWRDGALRIEPVHAAGAPDDAADGMPARLLIALRRYPVLVGLIALAVLVFPFALSLADGRPDSVALWLTVIDLSSSLTGPAALANGEVWRWFTPVLLHFSAVHLLFNLAVTYDLGRRIEFAQGSLRFAGLVLVTGLVSNVGQYLWSGNPLFGGLSGVAYGLLGFVLVCRRRQPDEKAWQVHPGFAFSLIIFLVIFSTGITEPFGLYVANEAHWLGIVTGGLLALFVNPARRSK